MPPVGETASSDELIYPHEAAKHIARVFADSSISFSKVLFDSNGLQCVVSSKQGGIEEQDSFDCSELVAKNKHPGVAISKKKLVPFDIFAYEEEFTGDVEIENYFEALHSASLRAVYFFPIRDLNNNLFVAAVTSKEKILSSLEMRLLHSQCLEEVAKLHDPENGFVERCGANLLSPRESECLIAAAKGLTEKETARLLGISPNTVSIHIANCRRKLDARNKLSAIIKGIGLIERQVWCKHCTLKPNCAERPE